MGNKIMGNKNSKTFDKYKYNLYFQTGENVIKENKYLIKKSNNITYIYFDIKNVSVFDIMNKNIKVYISRIDDDNLYEDKIDTTLENNLVKNKIEDKLYYDIKIPTNDSKHIIIRFENINKKNFKIIYID
tara:strand:+ start:179 stop:568 length:390 start_codon:yes stop_codon:yes gene_type:complete